MKRPGITDRQEKYYHKRKEIATRKRTSPREAGGGLNMEDEKKCGTCIYFKSERSAGRENDQSGHDSHEGIKADYADRFSHERTLFSYIASEDSH